MYKNIIDQKKVFFKTGITRNIEFRIKMLNNLKKSILKYEEDIMLALEKDLSRSKSASYTAEILPILQEIDYFIKNVNKLSKIKIKKTPNVFFGYKSYEIKEPYGVCFIISPWNYPLLLTISPLIGAIATGNCCIIKPSEYSINSSNVLKKIIDEAFKENYCQVILGEADVVENIIDNGVDFIFFTGSTNVGKIIMKKASETLTPISLELGGKSPCIVDKNIDLDKTAKRIVWGKTLNSGQTCIAPDYLLVDDKIKDKLIERLIFYTENMWNKNALKNSYYSKIINEKNFNKILNLINDGDILYGGNYDRETLKIEPTYITNVSMYDNIMKEEIFGPILPIISYNNIEQIYDIVEYNKNPLAMYIFSKNKSFIHTLIKNIPCGNVCINDTILQVSNHHIPFGGRGTSGIGVYHGEYSYDLFSHKKGILKANNIFDLQIRYKNTNNLASIKKLLKLIKAI